MNVSASFVIFVHLNGNIAKTRYVLIELILWRTSKMYSFNSYFLYVFYYIDCWMDRDKNACTDIPINK